MGIEEIKESYSNYIIEEMIKRLPDFGECWKETSALEQLNTINIFEDAIGEFIESTTEQMILNVKKSFDSRNTLTK
jgi:hypothetical protein